MIWGISPNMHFASEGENLKEYLISAESELGSISTD